MILFLLMNFVVGLSAFLFTDRILKINGIVDFFITLFLIYLSQVIITETLLGIGGVLFLKYVFLLNLAVLLVAYFICRRKKRHFEFFPGDKELAELFRNKAVLFACCVILGFGIIKVFINLVNSPFGWDDLNYHFTFPVEWLKQGNLDTPITIFDDPSPSYYPINGSLFFLWLILPLKNVLLADLAQVPFFILAFLSCYGISRKMGLDKEYSFYATALFMLIPNFFKQLQIAYVDVMTASLFLVCLNYLFLLNKKFSAVNTFIFSLSLGLLLGVKTIAIPYSILLSFPFLYLLIKNKSKSYFLFFSLLIILLSGGFSYIRNFIATGNPLYPLELRLFGRQILRGVMETYVYRAHFKIEDYSLSKLLFHEGLGIQSTIFILPAVFLALPAAFLKKKKQLDFNSAYFLALPFFIYLAYRYIIPLANTRYLYPLLGIGMVTAFYTLKILNLPRRPIRILVIICIMASIPELARRQELAASAILMLLLFFFFFPLIKFIRKNNFIRNPLVISVFLYLGFFFLILGERFYEINEYPSYVKMVKYSGFWPDAAKAWLWLNNNTQGNNIAYAGRPVPFPLYGTEFKNSVYYVSVNQTDPAKLHYFRQGRYHWGYDFSSLHRNLEEKGNYRQDADYSVWLKNLIARRTDYLFVYSLHQTKNIEFPLEDGWARANPDKFKEVFANGTIRIYGILK